MRKKSGFTIVEQATVLVPEFEKVVRKLDKNRNLQYVKERSFNFILETTQNRR